MMINLKLMSLGSICCIMRVLQERYLVEKSALEKTQDKLTNSAKEAEKMQIAALGKQYTRVHYFMRTRYPIALARWKKTEQEKLPFSSIRHETSRG